MLDSKAVLESLISVVNCGDYHQHGDEVSFQCPECKDESGHFAINVRKLVFNCWKCGFGGKVTFDHVDNIAKQVLFRLINNEPVKPLAGDLGTKFQLCQIVDMLAPTKDTPILSKFMEKHLQGLARKALLYCWNRGVTTEQVGLYRVSVCPFDNRAYFPYWDDGGKVLWYMGRSINNEEPKTVEPPNSEKPLFGWQVCARNIPFVVLVEGVFDHLVTPGSFAILGNHITEYQAGLLKKMQPRIVFVIGDPDASEAMVLTRQLLLQHKILTVLVHLADTDLDPNDLGRVTMARIVHRLRLMDYARPRDVRVYLSGGTDPVLTG